MSDTETDPTLTADLAAWLADLADWTAGHRFLSCNCVDRPHDVEHQALMERKARIVDRCEAVEVLGE